MYEHGQWNNYRPAAVMLFPVDLLSGYPVDAITPLSIERLRLAIAARAVRSTQ